jgi:hypothetical protein
MAILGRRDPFKPALTSGTYVVRMPSGAIQESDFLLRSAVLSVQAAYRFTSWLHGAMSARVSNRATAYPDVSGNVLSGEDLFATTVAYQDAVGSPGSIQVSPTRIDVLLMAVPVRYDQTAFLRGAGNLLPYEVRVSAGPSLAWLTTDSRLISAITRGDHRSYILFEGRRRDRQQAFGGVAAVETDYYITRIVSVGLSASYGRYVRMKVPPHLLINPYVPGINEKAIEAHGTTLSLAELMLGFRVHL